jgi:hypothetical protein
MTAHKQMLIAAKLLVAIKGKNEFSTSEIFRVLKCAGSTHPINTIQAEMLRCCINCPPQEGDPETWIQDTSADYEGKSYLKQFLSFVDFK